MVKYQKKSYQKKNNRKKIGRSDGIKIKAENNVKSFLIPKNINVFKVQEKIEAYRSNLSNMFTENDATLTEQGYLRSFSDKGYYGDVQKALTMEVQDDLIGGLVDTFTNTANTDLNINISSDNESELSVWEHWKKIVNINSKNQLPGLYNLNKTLFRSLILTGMATPDPVWKEVTINRKKYILPMDIVMYPSLGVKLASSNTYSDQFVFVDVSEDYYKSVINNADDDVEFKTLFRQFQVEDDKTVRAMLREDAYAIKYNYTPNNATLYPSPFLKRSFESVSLRHKLMDSDMSILEMIINAFIHVKVGNDKNIPAATKYDDQGGVIREGDLEQAQTMFESLDGQFETIVTPHYYEIKIVLPEGIDNLLDQKKYVQSQYNILSNFGIIMDPNSGSNTVEFDKRSYNNFLKNCESLQETLAGWYMWLANQIRIKNGNKIKSLPSIKFDIPELIDNAYLNNLMQITDRGYNDVYTLLEKFNLDPNAVIERKKRQITFENDNKGIFEPRATFAQKVVTDENNDDINSNDIGEGSDDGIK